MKRIFCLTVSIFMIFALVGCRIADNVPPDVTPYSNGVNNGVDDNVYPDNNGTRNNRINDNNGITNPGTGNNAGTGGAGGMGTNVR